MAGIEYDRQSDGDIIMNATWGGTNPTPGTSINDAIKTAFADTAATALFVNDDAGPGKIILPRYLRLLTRVAPASATSAELVVTVDNGNRYSSGGGAGAAPIVAAGSRSKYLSIPNAGYGKFYFGGLTLTAATANRKFLSRATLKNAIPVVGDEFLIVFTDPDDARSPVLTGTTAQAFACITDGIALDSGDSLGIHLYYPANAVTAAAYEFEVGWVVKTP